MDSTLKELHNIVKKCWYSTNGTLHVDTLKSGSMWPNAVPLDSTLDYSDHWQITEEGLEVHRAITVRAPSYIKCHIRMETF